MQRGADPCEGAGGDDKGAAALLEADERQRYGDDIEGGRQVTELVVTEEEQRCRNRDRQRRVAQDTCGPPLAHGE